MLLLYGHPFSSYTWKAEIALRAAGFDYALRDVSPDHPENGAFVAERGGPLATFPVLDDGGAVVFEATCIIEHLAINHDQARGLLPADAAAALPLRVLDRVFDNYVMAPMQGIVAEHIRNAEAPDAARLAKGRERLLRSYAWLEQRLADYPIASGHVSLVECAAAPALFYADWVQPIPPEHGRLAEWRARLLALEPVRYCVDQARPYRGFFPPGAPDRD